MAQTRAKAQFLTPGQVAELAQVTKRTVYSWIDRGWLPATTLGPSRLLRIKIQDWEEFVEAGDAA